MAFLLYFCLLLPGIAVSQTHIDGVNQKQPEIDPNNRYYFWVEELWNVSNHFPDDWLTKVELHDNFVVYDINKDGVITREEYMFFVEYYEPDLILFGNALYDIYDANNDHHLDTDDLSNLYNELDVDKDGMVTKVDWFKFWTKVLTDLEHLHGSGSLLG